MSKTATTTCDFALMSHDYPKANQWSTCSLGIHILKLNGENFWANKNAGERYFRVMDDPDIYNKMHDYQGYVPLVLVTTHAYFPLSLLIMGF